MTSRVGKSRMQGTYSSPTSGFYSIKVAGHLDSSWSEWLGGLTLVHQEDGTTLLSGLVGDQATLHSLLIKVRDLGVELISVNQVEAAPCSPGGDQAQTG